MNFGPLNADGGERRLNVAITRARVRYEVFTNLTAHDIDLTRTKARGVHALKTFLAYAEGADLDFDKENATVADAPLEEAVTHALATSGFRWRNVATGSTVLRSVVDPERAGRDLLALEDDGPSYQDARSTCDRDRLRAQVLESLGWRIARIWSPDWLRNPAGERKRLLAAIEDAQRVASEPIGDLSHAMNILAEVARQEPEEPPAGHEEDGVATSRVSVWPLYSITSLNGAASRLDHDPATVEQLLPGLIEVVRHESPVHADEVLRRLADAADLKRIGPRFQSTFEAACAAAVEQGSVRRQADFFWDPAMREPVPRDRRELPASSRRLELVAHEEIAVAILSAVRDAYGMEPGSIPSQVSRQLGFPRMSDEMRTRIESIVKSLIEERRLVGTPGNVVVSEEGKPRA